MVRRSRRTIALVFLLVTGLASVFVLSEPLQFDAESRLMIRIGREYAYRPEVAGSQSPRAPSLSEIVNSEVEILSSRDLAEQVVRSIGARELYPDIAKDAPDPERAAQLAILSFRKAVSIRSVLESSVIKLSFEHPSPEIAATAVNLLVDRFADKHLEVFGEERSDALKVQMAQRESRLQLADEALSGFKSRNSIFDLEEQRRLLLGQRLLMENALRASELELAELRSLPGADDPPPTPIELPPHLSPGMTEALLRQAFALKNELRGLTPDHSDPIVRDATMRLLDLELEEARLLRDYNPSNRKVLGVRAEIERVRGFLSAADRHAGAPAEAPLPERDARADELTSEIAALEHEIELLVQDERQRLSAGVAERRQAAEARCDDLREHRSVLDEEIRLLDGHETTLRQLERERDAAGATLEECRARVEDARLGEELDREKQISVRVIERAVPPAVPSGLSRSLKLALAAAGGLLAGIASAVLADLLRAR